MTRLQIIGPWSGSGTEDDPNRPQALADHRVGMQSITDIAGQDGTAIHPAPNLGAWEVVCEDATADAIESDATYMVITREAV